MREFDEKSITAAVLARMDQCDDPRFKQVMTSLVTHLHDFVREVKLTDAEWFGAIQFLTSVGQTCTDKRQEFILLSDTLGVSILVITLNHPASDGTSDSTVQGPYYWAGAPELPNGANLAVGVKGEAAFYSGRVLSSDGRPIAGAVLDVWSGDGEGTYDMQMEGDVGMKARGRIRTDAEGRYSFRSIKPEYYPVPTDGPVGVMLNKMGRHPMRPGHIHMIVSAPGHHAITTHLFAAGSPYIDSDAVFGVKESLVTPYAKHPAGAAPDGTRIDAPYYTVNYDFRLRRM
jgi:hydroxyquinol 1,2-dioxygenase